jgi:TonB family protein
LSKYQSLLAKEISDVDIDINSLRQKNLLEAKTFNKEFFAVIAFFFSIVLVLVVFLLNSLEQNSLDAINKTLESLSPFFSTNLSLSADIIADLKFAKPISNLIFIVTLVFSVYIFSDLLFFKQRDKIVKSYGANGQVYYNYSNSTTHFSESFFLSYTIHILILLILILTLLLIWKGKPKVNVTSIEFIPTQIESKKAPKKTNRRAAKNSIDQGKHNPLKKETPATPVGKPEAPTAKKSETKPTLKAPPKIMAKPKTVQQPAEKKVFKPASFSKISPKPNIKPSPKVLVAQTGENQVDAPINRADDLPKLLDYQPDSSATATGSSSTPSPRIEGESRGIKIISRLGSIPRAPDSLGQTGNRGAYGDPGNPGDNPFADRAPSLAAEADINFGPYMSSLQRKIKRSWKPPRGSESNRIVVTFTVLQDGRLGNLKIIRSSPNPEANMAALKAVTDASPFEPLPPGAGPDIDIEFTFDYNVFQNQRF